MIGGAPAPSMSRRRAGAATFHDAAGASPAAPAETSMTKPSIPLTPAVTKERLQVRAGAEVEHDRRRCDRDVVLAVALATAPEDRHAPERPVPS